MRGSVRRCKVSVQITENELSAVACYSNHEKYSFGSAIFDYSRIFEQFVSTLLDSALKALEFPPPGPRPLLSQDELDLLVAKADTFADHGKGFSTRRLSAEAKRLCAAIAEKENDPKMRERLEIKTRSAG